MLDHSRDCFSSYYRHPKRISVLPPAISRSQFYTLFSRAKSRDKVLLLNFEPEDVTVNEFALKEMVQMRSESLFSWQHLLIELNGISMCLFNIRSWNSHLEHFLNEKIYSTYSSLFCFTETNINDSPAKRINDILDDWKDIHKNTQYGLALCYNMSKVNTTEVIETPSVLEVSPAVLEIEMETFLLLIVYHMPDPLGSFIDDFIDQMLPEHVAKVDPQIQNFNLSHLSQYSTHIHGVILDLVFDTSNSNTVSSLLSPLSDHFALFFLNLMHYIYAEFSCKQFSF